MQEYDIISAVLARHGLGDLYDRHNDTAVEYIQKAVEKSGSSFDIEISSVRLVDDTVQLQYTQVQDKEEEIFFITDLKLGLVSDDNPCINARELCPAILTPECDDDVIWGTRRFIYHKQLLVIEGCGNAIISYKLCDVPKMILEQLKATGQDVSKLSKETAERIIEFVEKYI